MCARACVCVKGQGVTERCGSLCYCVFLVFSRRLVDGSKDITSEACAPAKTSLEVIHRERLNQCVYVCVCVCGGVLLYASAVFVQVCVSVF